MSTAAGVLSPIWENSILSSVYKPGRRMNPLWSEESILIYLTFSDRVIPLRVLESDSIASVKLKIQTFKGFTNNKQMLVHRGKELARNDCLVRDYGVSDGNVLHLIIRLSDLLTISVKTICGKELEFQVERCRDIAYVKQQITRKGNGVVDLKDDELVYNGKKLEDDLRLLNDICKDEEAVIHLIAVRRKVSFRGKSVEKGYELSIVATELKEFDVVTEKPPERKHWLKPVVVNPTIHLYGVFNDLVEEIRLGMRNGYLPFQSSEGSGGAYFMFDGSGDKYAAVFKPTDEEPLAVNNPRGLPMSLNGEGLKRGTRVGEGAFREVAAFILDHPKNGRRVHFDDVVGFSGVPPTMMIRCMHPGFNHPQGFDCPQENVKIGSLQKFVRNSGSCEDMGSGSFPVHEVHKITVLDIRLANADRHAGNILVSENQENGETMLVPIDHGYCLPENFEDCTFDWLYWPQARVPYDRETLDYIKSMNADDDIALLKLHGWEISVQCSRTLQISTMLLKKGAARGLSAFTIGNLMCRETVNKEACIEEIVHEAEDALLPGMSENAFLEAVSCVMDRRLDELKSK